MKQMAPECEKVVCKKGVITLWCDWERGLGAKWGACPAQ